MILGGQKMQSLLKRFESKDKDKDDIQSHRVPFHMTFGKKDSCPHHQKSRSCMSSKVQRTHQVSGTLDETLEIRGGIRPWVAWVACRSMVGRQHAGPRLVCSVAMDFILRQRW